MLTVTDAWKAAHPGGCAGVLVMREVINTPSNPSLDILKEAMEAELRARFTGADRDAVRATEPIKSYDAYFSRYRRPYIVQQQVEAVALQGRAIPRITALVEAMFMAELKNMILTGGHDLDALTQPLKLDVGEGTESYTVLDGGSQIVGEGDMVLADAEGVIASVIYGPDERTKLTESTSSAVFAAYGPLGVSPDAMRSHLDDLRGYIEVVSPNAQVEASEVFTAA